MPAMRVQVVPPWQPHSDEITYKEEEVEEEQKVLGDGDASFPHGCVSESQKTEEN